MHMLKQLKVVSLCWKTIIYQKVIYLIQNIRVLMQSYGLSLWAQHSWKGQCIIYVRFGVWTQGITKKLLLKTSYKFDYDRKILKNYITFWYLTCYFLMQCWWCISINYHLGLTCLTSDFLKGGLYCLTSNAYNVLVYD